MALTAGTLVGRYRLDHVIGEGGMGRVYLAHDPQIGRALVVKVLSDDVDRAFLAREAHAAARIVHPAIVTIYDIGEHQGRPFIAMEYIEGRTLDAVITGQMPATVSQRLHFVEQLCEGLAAAHQARVYHLDVKPANLMVDRRSALRILDFGIARAGDQTVRANIEGSIAYMAPEQIRGDAMDHRADVFAATAVLYELLSGRRAFTGGTAGIARRLVDTTVGPVAPLVCGIGPAIDRVIAGGLAIDPDSRTPSAIALGKQVADVRRALDTRVGATTVVVPGRLGMSVPGASPVSDVGPSREVDFGSSRPGMSRSWTISASVLAAASLLLVLAFAFLSERQVRNQPEATGTANQASRVGGDIDDGKNQQGAESSQAATSVSIVERSARAGSLNQAAEARGRPVDQGAASEGGRLSPAPTPAAEGPADSGVGARPLGAHLGPAAVGDSPDEPRGALPDPDRPPGASAEAPAATPEAASVVAADSRQIRGLVDRFASALNARSAVLVKDVFPGVSDEELAALDRAFLDADRYDVGITIAAVQTVGDMARAGGQMRRTVVQNGVVRDQSGATAFQFRRVGGVWRITSVDMP